MWDVDAAATLTLTEEEEALLAEALPSAPDGFGTPGADDDAFDFLARQQEDQAIRRRTEHALSLLVAERAELRELLAVGAFTSDADKRDAGRAARQREVDRLLAEATAEVDAWQPHFADLCERESLLASAADVGGSDIDSPAPFPLTANNADVSEALSCLAVGTGDANYCGSVDSSIAGMHSASLHTSLASQGRNTCRAPRVSDAGAGREITEGRLEGSRREGLLADLAKRDETRRRMIADLMGGDNGCGGGCSGDSSAPGALPLVAMMPLLPIGSTSRRCGGPIQPSSCDSVGVRELSAGGKPTSRRVSRPGSSSSLTAVGGCVGSACARGASASANSENGVPCRGRGLGASGSGDASSRPATGPHISSASLHPLPSGEFGGGSSSSRPMSGRSHPVSSRSGSSRPCSNGGGDGSEACIFRPLSSGGGVAVPSPPAILALGAHANTRPFSPALASLPSSPRLRCSGSALGTGCGTGSGGSSTSTFAGASLGDAGLSGHAASRGKLCIGSRIVNERDAAVQSHRAAAEMISSRRLRAPNDRATRALSR